MLVGSDEIDNLKPAPDGLLLASERLGVHVARVAYVGDASNDLGCARAAQAVPVAAGWGHLYEPDHEHHLLARTPADLITLLAPRPACRDGRRNTSNGPRTESDR